MTRRYFFVMALAFLLTPYLRAEPVELAKLLAQAHDTSTALAFDKYPAMRDLAAAGRQLAAEWLKVNAGNANAPAVVRLEKGFAALMDNVGEEEWRKRVAELQAGLMEIVRVSDELKSAWNLYFCPMVKKFWAQPAKEDMANPYMGTKMLDCGVQKTWDKLPKDIKGWP